MGGRSPQSYRGSSARSGWPATGVGVPERWPEISVHTRLVLVTPQFAAANSSRHPELGGHVEAEETRGYWRQAQYSPNARQGYHYWHNAETYYYVGRAMAAGMLSAMDL